MPETTPAWLLSVADDIQFSIGEHQAVEYIESPVLQYVPLTPEYSTHVLFWQNSIIPVIDMNLLFEKPAATSNQHIMVVAYQKKDYAPLQHVAFILSSAPEKIMVNDDDASELPDFYPQMLKPSVLSIFNYNQKLTSVLNIAQLSSGIIPD